MQRDAIYWGGVILLGIAPGCSIYLPPVIYVKKFVSVATIQIDAIIDKLARNMLCM